MNSIKNEEPAESGNYSQFEQKTVQKLNHHRSQKVLSCLLVLVVLGFASGVGKYIGKKIYPAERSATLPDVLRTWRTANVGDLSLEIPGELKPSTGFSSPKIQAMIGKVANSTEAYQLKGAGYELNVTKSVYPSELIPNLDGAAQGAIARLSQIDGVSGIEHTIRKIAIAGRSGRKIEFLAKRQMGSKQAMLRGMGIALLNDQELSVVICIESPLQTRTNASTCTRILDSVNIIAPSSDVESSLRDAIELYDSANEDQSKLTQAVESFEALHRKGSVEAAVYLGKMYARGQGVLEDRGKAEELLAEAARRGSVRAEYELGEFHKIDLGFHTTASDNSEALKWYERAAEHGDAEAQFELYMLYVRGNGVPKDFELSKRYLIQSAKGGLALAQYTLGMAYLHGMQPIEENRKEAILWLQKAAASGHAESQSLIENIKGD